MYPRKWPALHRTRWPRGKLILANTGLGIDTWRLRSLEHFANTLRDLQLGPHVVVGGSAFVFSDMISMMRRGRTASPCVALAGAAGVVLLLLGARTARASNFGQRSARRAGYAEHRMSTWYQSELSRLRGSADYYRIGVDYAVNIAARAKATTHAERGTRCDNDDRTRGHSLFIHHYRWLCVASLFAKSRDPHLRLVRDDRRTDVSRGSHDIYAGAARLADERQPQPCWH